MTPDGQFKDLSSVDPMGGLSLPAVVQLELPAWLSMQKFNALAADKYISHEDQMSLAIALAKTNVTEQTGGPFGAAIFMEDGTLLGVGVNRVVPQSNPTAHAEIVAIQFTSHLMGTFDLASLGKLTLASSAQPCAMCCGAIPWSGISTLLTGATASDTERLTGFDEGPIHPEWKEEYKKRGILVVDNVLRADACAVFQLYKDLDGQIYNGRRDTAV